MSRALVTEQHLTDIANAIRAKNGSSDAYTPAQMASAISAIEGGGGGDVIVQGEGPWTISVVNPEHTIITSTPQAFLSESGGGYTPSFRTVESFSMDTGYSPGRAIKTVDEGTHAISVTATPAEEIAGMVQDGWGAVYQNGATYYSDSGYSIDLSSLQGDIVVVGMRNNDLTDWFGLSIDSGVRKYKNNFITAYGDGCFNNTSLTYVEMGNLVSAGTSMLASNYELESAVLPNLVTAASGLLQYCNKLKNVNLPSLETVQDLTLNDCNELISVRFKALKNVPAYALQNASCLETLILAGDSVVSFANASNCLLSEVNIYVPQALVNAYKAHAHWSSFGDKIQPATEEMLNDNFGE